MRPLGVTIRIVAYVVACVAVVSALTVWLYAAADSDGQRLAAVAVGGLAGLLLLAGGVFLARRVVPTVCGRAAAERPSGAGTDPDAGVARRDTDDPGAGPRPAEGVGGAGLSERFLVHMGHELRTPLSAIIGFAEAIRDGVAGEPSPQQREFAEDIHRAGRQLLRMINDILDLSKPGAAATALVLEPCDLSAMVDEVLRVGRGLARRDGVDLVADVVPRPLELTADPMKLRQVLYNLLSNAIKFTGAGGTVTVRGRLETELVRIEVRDTGVGIAPEDLVTVFEEYTQAGSAAAGEGDGTGLGLALTKRLVEMHGGEITVESEPGKGSTFTVTLLRDLVVEEGQ